MRARSLVLALLALVGTGCGDTPSVSYTVSIPDPASDSVRVDMTLIGFSRDSLVLRGHAARELLAPVDLTMSPSAREGFAPRVDWATAGKPDRPVQVARVAIAGPLPREIHLSYAVRVRHRQGDSHVGFSGTSLGTLDPRFGLFTGRNIFLVPEPAPRLRRAEVAFVLPPGWGSVTPWRREGGRWRVGLSKRDVAEDLIAGTIGLGRFDHRSFVVGRTTFACAFEEGIARPERDSLERCFERVARFLHHRFPRGLGPAYQTLVVPAASTGDELLGDAWANGQGGTLAPATPGHVRRFAERLLDAYLVYEPYRTTFQRPEDFWLVDGLRGLYACRSVAAAGLWSEQDALEQLVAGYFDALEARSSEHDLERVYQAGDDGRIARELVSPLAALYLDLQLRESSGEERGLDDVIRVLFSSRSAPSIWPALSRSASADWNDVRHRYVQGRAALPIERLAPLERIPPNPVAGPAVQYLTVAYTGESFGFLEHCGCEVNQSGGLARRATVLNRLRGRGDPLLLLDAGSAFIKSKHGQPADALSLHEQGFYLRSMDLMKYDAAAIGTTELASGLEHFRSMSRGLHTPYLSSNVQADGGAIAPARRIVSRGGRRIGIIGVFEPPRSGDASYERNVLQVTIDDPAATLCREVEALRPSADLVVALGRLSPRTIRRLVRECKGLDLVISSDPAWPRLDTIDGQGTLRRDDASGFVGKTLVLYASLKNYGFSSARIGLGRQGRIVSAEFEDHWLDEAIPDEPSIRSALGRFYEQVGTLEDVQAGVRPPFGGDDERMSGRYVGAERCATCHQPQFAQWEGTPHARAYKTLLDQHRQFQPRCVSCHVVGYGATRGFRMGTGDETLANVQCESCHGPGGRHVEAPAAANIQRAVPERVCVECHDMEHSSRFVYSDRLPRVTHGWLGGETANAGGAAGDDRVAIDPHPVARPTGREK
ncbi:MAG TPA: multiheme c-type cytochrome [Candidatus Eisenbacteria bacterium]|nr:multiheme c-type cytochrome [Candidatus Eisenbacteria bacterium]